MKFKIKKVFVVCFLLLSICLGIKSVYCDGDINSISLNKTSLSLNVGDKSFLSASYTPPSVDSSKLSFVWGTSNSKVVIVDGSGNLTAIGPGKAVVSVTVSTINGSKKFTAKCVVNVLASNIKVKLSGCKDNIINKENSITSNVDIKKWAISNVGNVKVLSTGKKKIKFRALKSGKYLIKAVGVNGKKSECSLQIKYPKFKLSGCDNIGYGQKKNIYSNIKVKKWQVSDPDSVTILKDGKDNFRIKAIKPGVITISATSVNNKKASCSIKINDTRPVAERILYEVDEFYKKVEKDGNWVHRQDRGEKKYKGYSGWTSCDRVVTKALKRTGHYVGSGTLSHSGGKYPKNYKKLKNMKIIFTHNMNELQPGDVMVRNGGSQNIAIFAYKKNGKYYVYGASSTNEIRKKHPYPYKWWKNNGISMIIRATD